MATRNHSGRNVALVGGAGLVAWWLLSRGKGFGFRGEGSGKDNNEAAKPSERPARVVVWIRADRLEIDNVVADLPTVIARSREAGSAEVHATGSAITRVVREVLTSLHAANVKIYARPDLAYMVPSAQVLS